MQLNGNFSWRTFFLGFFTRKFIIAVALQILATYLTYYAIDQITITALEAKVQADQIIKLCEYYFWFTVMNGGTFGLFNSTSKFAGISMEKIKQFSKAKNVVEDSNEVHG